MKLVIINGNSSPSISQGIITAARQAARTGTDLEMVTPKFGPVTIEGYLDGELSALAICEEVSRGEGAADASVIACYSDPGLYAAREISDKPVIGIAEASMVTAVQLGHRFSILTPLRRLRPVLSGLVQRYGFDSRCCSVVSVEVPVAEAAKLSQATQEAFIAAGRTALERDGAEVLILGGAVLPGLDGQVSQELKVPILDPVKCAVVQAEALVRLGLTTSKVGGFGFPRRKVCLNPPGELTKFYEAPKSQEGN